MNTCPVGSICFNKENFFLLMFITISLLAHYIRNTSYDISNLKNGIDYYKNDIDNKLSLYKNQLDQNIVNKNNIIDSINDSNESLYKERVDNILLPPQRSPQYAVEKIPINIPTRGPTSGYQQVGVLIQVDGIGNNKVKLPLFGQKLYPRSRQWNYYVGSDGFNSIKLPIFYNGRNSMDQFGCDEIYNEGIVNVEGYDSAFKASIYSLDSPKYLPHIL